MGDPLSLLRMGEQSTAPWDILRIEAWIRSSIPTKQLEAVLAAPLMFPKAGSIGADRIKVTLAEEAQWLAGQLQRPTFSVVSRVLRGPSLRKLRHQLLGYRCKPWQTWKRKRTLISSVPPPGHVKGLYMHREWMQPPSFVTPIHPLPRPPVKRKSPPINTGAPYGGKAVLDIEAMAATDLHSLRAVAPTGT